MKRFSAIMLVSLLLITTILSVSAADYTYPELPKSSATYYVFYTNMLDGGTILVFTNDKLSLEGDFVTINSIDSYNLVGDEWVVRPEGIGTIEINKSRIIYDSSGIVITDNNITIDSSLVEYDDFSGVIVSMTDQINVTTVIEIIVFTIGIIVGLVFLYWGIRKVVRAIMTAFKKGKISL